MDVQLTHNAELKALGAQDYAAFGGLNIRHIKAQVYELLRHVGEQGIFESYTRHDSAHIEAMLAMLDWVVPKETADRLTAGDWLLIVLSVYLHDLGMLVTRDEFTVRNDSGFPEYRRRRLESTDNEGKDYAEKVSRLGPDEAERFLYQEFVRRFHASRIRAWVDGNHSVRLGAAAQAVQEVAKLLESVDSVFRSDLGLVCESHHENDLDNLTKYPIRRHYGSNVEESANVQYAAVVLRTVDLLQITRDRTPSISFRVLNPSDPLSQLEWSKQMAVRAVTDQPKRDRDGNVDLSLQSDTIEVHAHFEREDGFFALTSYLSYAQDQLNQSYKWIEDSGRRHGSKYRFPWRNIDESQITTKGFLPHQYEFNIDQHRVLDLLTGHTLYNDSSVVVRELAQNAIDAVRLQHSDNEGRELPGNAGSVKIRWLSESHTLIVEDNGTGMTQGMIENNFLRVGASRYQEDAFKKQFPHFSPISRFGIGVLSAFMIADAVEVLTCHPLEPHARQISLRSVHGKYLIRLLEKDDAAVSPIRDHGTIVKLTIRASAKLGNVVALAKSWFVLPRCRLSVQIDDQQPEVVGYSSLTQVLEHVLAAYPRSVVDRKFEIREFQRDGLSLAYAVEWSRYYRVWKFVSVRFAVGEFAAKMGTCIEGVRVKEGTPGFAGAPLIAIANVVGPESPRTNVARSNIDETPQYRRVVEGIYRGYCDHIQREIEQLSIDRGFSPTRAAQEGIYITHLLLMGLYDTDRLATRRTNLSEVLPNDLRQALRTQPFFAVEDDGTRKVLTLEELNGYDSISTVDDSVAMRAESFLRELPVSMSLEQLESMVPGFDLQLPTGPLLMNGRTEQLGRLFEFEWEPLAAVAESGDQPRLIIHWKRIATGGPLWRRIRFSVDPAIAALIQESGRPRMHSGRDYSSIAYAVGDFGETGLDRYDGFGSADTLYLLPNRAWRQMLGCESTAELAALPRRVVDVVAAFTASLMLTGTASRKGRNAVDQAIQKLIELTNGDSAIFSVLNEARVSSAFASGSWKIFDTNDWESRDPERRNSVW